MGIFSTFTNLLNPYKSYRLSRNSFTDNVFYDTVKPKVGSVVLCDLSPIPGLSLLGLQCEHTGIYAGKDGIIHRNGDGYIEGVSPSEFLERINGRNAAISIYVSSYDDKSISFPNAARRARRALTNSKHDGYNLLWKNCHNFTRYCITGDEDQWGLDFTFSSLEDLLWDDFEFNNWRVWHYK